jgi:hypothetical protein
LTGKNVKESRNGFPDGTNPEFTCMDKDNALKKGAGQRAHSQPGIFQVSARHITAVLPGQKQCFKFGG